MGWFSSVTDALGFTDEKAEREARETRDVQLARTNKITDESIEFQKEQYNDWKDVYGEITDNLGEYFNNLDPEDITTRNLQAYQKEYQGFRRKLKETLTQRGISDSKFAAAEEMKAEFGAAGARAGIRAAAPVEAAREKEAFLGIGLGQGTSYLGNVAGVSTAGVSAGVSLTGQFNKLYGGMQAANLEGKGAFVQDVIGAGKLAGDPTKFLS